MMIKILILFFSVAPSVFALEEGACRAIPESKVYLSDHFSLPYPKDVTFTCLYECLGTDQELSDEVLGTTTIRVRNKRDDALKVVCQGVKVKRTSWGYDFDRVMPFYSYKTRIKELRKWADENVSKENPFEREELLKLKQKIHEVVEGYRHASRSNVPAASSFLKSLEFLEGLVEGVPGDVAALDESLQNIRSGQPIIFSDDLANQLTTDILKSLAYWR